MKATRLLKKITSVSLLVALVFAYAPTSIDSASLTSGSVAMTSAVPSATSVTYTLTFSGVTTSAIKCIKVAFSDAATAGSKPSNMSITGLALSGTSTYIPTPASWTVSNNNSTGVSSITFASGETPASASNRTVVLTGITNGDTAGTKYFLQFSTYNNTDCSSSGVDSSTINFIYTTGQVVSATVDPTLSMSVAGVSSGATLKSAADVNITTTSSTIPFGTLTTASNKIAAHDITVGTNANTGYTTTIRYSGTLSSGSHSITDHTGTNASPTAFSAAGTEKFGYTTNDAVLGTGTTGRFGSNNVWAGFTTTASTNEVAYSNVAVSETTRIGYQVGISSTTPAGAYSTTVDLISTPLY
jgi:hypothetical protein